MIPQTPYTPGPPAFGTNNFAENPEQRCPCVLLLDTSGSMNGAPIAALNDGLRVFYDDLITDPLASKRVEVAVVTFGGPVYVAVDFTTVAGFHPPALTAGGDTPMGAAIFKGVEMVRQRKEAYKANGIPYFRPWLFLITDGAPTDNNAWVEAAAVVKQGEARDKFALYTVGVEGANFDVLRKLSDVREPLKLKGLNFRELFLWLSATRKAVSRRSPEPRKFH